MKYHLYVGIIKNDNKKMILNVIQIPKMFVRIDNIYTLNISSIVYSYSLYFTLGVIGGIGYNLVVVSCLMFSCTTCVRCSKLESS